MGPELKSSGKPYVGSRLTTGRARFNGAGAEKLRKTWSTPVYDANEDALQWGRS